MFIIKQAIDISNSKLPQAITESIINKADKCSFIIKKGIKNDEKNGIRGVEIIDFNTLEVVRFIDVGYFHKLSVNSTGKIAITSSYKKEICVWDLTTGIRMPDIVIDTLEFFTVVHTFTSNNELLIGCLDKIMRYKYDEQTKTFSLVHSYVFHSNDVITFITISNNSNSNIAVCGTHTGLIHVFDIAKNELLYTLTKIIIKPDHTMNEIKHLSINNNILIASSYNDINMVFDLEKNTHVVLQNIGDYEQTQISDVHQLLLCPCGKKVIGTNLYNHYIWDISTGKIIDKQPGYFECFLSFTPGGTHLVCGKGDSSDIIIKQVS